MFRQLIRKIIAKIRGEQLLWDTRNDIVRYSNILYKTITTDYRQRLAITKYEMLYSMNINKLGIHSDLYEGEEYIVSLTTHSKRIHQVYLAIESIMNQSMKPNKIILWLDKDTFSYDNIPFSIKQQIGRGLEVRFVKDKRSYTKLIYALNEYPNANIIVIDDDILYPFDAIERLINVHKKNPDCICCHYGKDLNNPPTSDRKSLSYCSCNTVKSNADRKSKSIVPEGFSGVLYPPHSLNEECFNEDVFLTIAPTCDDLWFKAMSLLNDTNVVEVCKSTDEILDYVVVMSDCQDIGLKNYNYSGGNDKQFHAIFSKYNLYNKW